MQQIRLNCDLGESFGVYRLCDESRIIPLVDQANIACGFHAGDPSSLLVSLALCVTHSVAVGAHPSYPDLQGFGRRSMSMPAAELEANLLYQLSALYGLAELQGAKMHYVKPHGALYNDMMKDNDILHIVLAAIARFDKNLDLMLLGTPNFADHQRIADKYQIKLQFEAFADRRYTAEGALTPRSQQGAVLDHTQAMSQTERFIAGKASFPVHSLCVHGDSPDAIAMVESIRTLLSSNG